MANTSFNVNMQGISRDMRSANGDFDTVEFGNIPEDKFRKLLAHLSQFSEPDHDPDEESCPPVVTAESPAGLFSFTMNGGSIWCDNAQRSVTAEEAGDIIAGRVASTPSREGVATHDNPNYQPAWMTHIPPTDQFNTHDSSIDTGTNSPQIFQEVWNTNQAYNNGCVCSMTGVFTSIFALVVLMDKPNYSMSAIATLISLILFAIPVMTRSKRRVIFRLGFDPASNTLWSVRGTQPLSWHVNGNEIVDFRLLDFEDRKYGPILERWRVDLIRSNGAVLEVSSFVKKSEAKAVILKAKALFQSLSEST